MLKSLIISISKKTFSKIEWYHLLEHCLVEEVQQLIKNSTLKNEGIVIEAETFIDGCYIEIIFSNSFIYEELINIINKAKKNIVNITSINEQLEIINDEVKHNDLTVEEAVLYKPTNYILNQQIEDLYSPLKKENETNILNLLNNFECKIIFVNSDYIEVIQDADLKFIKNEKENYAVFKQHPYYYGYFKTKIRTLDEFLIASLLSFIFGKSSSSIIDKLYLNKHNYYLGYSHDIVIYGEFISLFIADSSEETKFFKKEEFLSYINTIDFLMYLNSFATYFLLTETPRSIAKILSRNLNFHKPINYTELIQNILNIKKTDLLSLVNSL